MLERISQKLIDVLCALPKAIVDWFNLTDANILYLQYIALALPIVALILKLPFSKSIKNQGYDPNGFKKMGNLDKIILTVIIVLLYDKVVRAYFPLWLREGLNIVAYGLYILFAIILLMIAMLFIRAILDCLATIHSCITFMIFGKSKRILPVYDVGVSVRFKVITGLIGYSLGRLLDSTALLFGAIVLYYNYCV